jgi:pSer/pThr/pTyr-binding forkhead associated (FHA) protein
MDIPPRISITLMSGPRDGEVIQFNIPKDQPEITFGRRENCDVCLNYDSQVSRLHARITYDEESFWLEDLGSRNGTYIGEGALEDRVEIMPGTVFRVGRTWIQLDPLPSDETQAAEPIDENDL